MRLLIISPVSTLCSEEVERATFPGEAGQFTVLTGHAPLLSGLVEGDIEYVAADGTTHKVRIRTGCVRVLNDNIEACVEEKV